MINNLRILAKTNVLNILKKISFATTSLKSGKIKHPVGNRNRIFIPEQK